LRILVLVGAGINGGGEMTGLRHLFNLGLQVDLVLTKPKEDDMITAPQKQWAILEIMGQHNLDNPSAYNLILNEMLGKVHRMRPGEILSVGSGS